MKLVDLLSGYEYELVIGDENKTVTDIAYGSKKVKSGGVFVALAGEKTDGHSYIADAVKNGAGVVVVQRTNKEYEEICQGQTTLVKVIDTVDALAYMSSRFYERPSESMKVIAVTGTNGKTTITYLLESICMGENQIAGVIGTINYRFADRQYPSSLTTPLSKELQQLLAEMKTDGVQCVVMEASSHALDKKRLDYTDIDCAVFTNLTQDHLDYHKDFDSYFAAKKRLFSDILEGSKKDKKAAVSNYDDPYGRKIADEFSGKKVYYSIYSTEADYYAENVQISVDGIEAEIVTPKGNIQSRSELLGAHNLSNILAAAAAAIETGYSTEAVKRGIESVKNIPGRLQRIKNSKGVNIFVDYAHTPDALKNVLSSVRELCAQRLIVVFGCGGDRDRAKRPMMGAISQHYCDAVIITSDNPRTEDPEKILDEIENGMMNTVKDDGTFCRIADRYEAIVKSVKISNKGDTIIIAGKGHEDYQIIGDKKIDFDDTVMCAKALNEEGFGTEH